MPNPSINTVAARLSRAAPVMSAVRSGSKIRSRRHTETDFSHRFVSLQESPPKSLGRRGVIEYLLSPVQKAWHEAGRER